jgi:uncharacterized protein (DUF305 family)
MMNRKQLLAAVSALALLGAPAYAAMDHSMHMATPKLSKSLSKNSAVKDYIKANKIMHKGMAITYSGDADVDFVAGMIPHHQGAVDMAEVILKYGKDEEMKALAQRIITWQKAEIGFMKQWLSGRTSAWRAKDADKLPSVKAYEESMMVMHRDMNIKFTGNADVDFVRGMIPHHRGAIDMAWILKKHGKDRNLSKFADEIIRSQGQEIRLMQAWLDKQECSGPEKKNKKSKHKKSGHKKST